MTDRQLPGPDVPVFVISVAAELSGLHPQTLRTYDRLGLVSPGRTGGGGRRYSLRDVELLRAVVRLTADGLGLEGVRRVLALEQQVLDLQAEVDVLRTELAATLQATGSAVPHQGNLPVPMPRTSAQVVLWRRG